MFIYNIHKHQILYMYTLGINENIPSFGRDTDILWKYFCLLVFK